MDSLQQRGGFKTNLVPNRALEKKYSLISFFSSPDFVIGNSFCLSVCLSVRLCVPYLLFYFCTYNNNKGTNGFLTTEGRF